MKRQLSCRKIIFTLIGFIILWTIVTDAWGYSDFILQNVPYNIGGYIYRYLSRCIWVAPAILLINRHNNQLKINGTELYGRPKFHKPLIIVMAISVCYVLVGMLISHNGLWFNVEICLVFVLVKYIIVGFVEETVFRGWGYNALVNLVSEKDAIILSTLFFVLLYWPAYFVKLYRFGSFDFAGMLGQSSSAFIWGLVCCWLLKKGKSLWNPIIAHIFYDFTYVLLVGGN